MKWSWKIKDARAEVLENNRFEMEVENKRREAELRHKELELKDREQEREYQLLLKAGRK